MYHLHQEAEPSDRTALEAVVDHVKEEIERLNKQVSSRLESCQGAQVILSKLWFLAGMALKSSRILFISMDCRQERDVS